MKTSRQIALEFEYQILNLWHAEIVRSAQWISGTKGWENQVKVGQADLN